MAHYYLDIETTGLKPADDKIITIQYQELERYTLEPRTDLVILKEWETSEKDIIKRFSQYSPVKDNYKFSFISIGYNLNFDLSFLVERANQYNIDLTNFLKKPRIDLHTVGILMNRGELKNSGADRVIVNKKKGDNVIEWYKNKEYKSIEQYIKREAKGFVEFLGFLTEELPKLRMKYLEQ